MEAFAEIIKHLLGETPTDTQRQLDKAEILVAYAKVHGVDRTQAALAFEAEEAHFRQPLVIGGWRIVYSPLSTTFNCERIPSPDQLERWIELSNARIMQELRSRLGGMDGYDFERLIAETLRAIPGVVSVQHTKLAGDGGVDFTLLAETDFGQHLAVGQVKRWGSKVGGPEMQKFVGVLETHSPRPDMGIYIATSGFTAQAEQVASQSRTRIHRYTLDDVVRWHLDSQHGVKAESFDLLRLDRNFWKELGDA
ncbi:MAG TPA: restriction endonuclease [Candidatus Thermoplasmatota archaeon]|nr:restriction endonuclease [Candidatus Thermoplasmatota archaeon]